MANISAAFGGFARQWNRLGFNQKVTIGTLALGMIGATAFLFTQAQDDYDVLYANMSLPDAAATVARLKDAKAPYKLADGGTTIMVPRGQKGELTLATAGELSSDQTVTLSQIPPIVQGDIQKEWIKKFNTDSIAQILKSIRGIKNAQVIVSQPEQNLFSEDVQVPSASVMLIVDPGFRLKVEQIKSIKHLVSHAVPGLSQENVAIADNSGNSLEDTVGNGANGPGLSEGEVRRKNYEDETTHKVLAVLAPVVGKENAVVSVSAQLNFDQSQAKIHRVIPSGGESGNPTGLPVSQQENVEEYGGAGAKPGGAAGGGEPGTTTNSPSYQAEDPAGGKNKKDVNYRNSRKTINYTNSEEDKSVVYAAGTVERMTIAVVLNKVLTAKETEEIKDIVTNAAGIDIARGDSVEVKGFQFSQPPGNKDKELADATKSAFDQAFYLQIASVAGGVILSLGALFVFYNLLKRPADGELVSDEPEDEVIFLPSGSDAGMNAEVLSQYLASNQGGSAGAITGDGGNMALLMGSKSKKAAANYILPEIESDPELEAKRDSIEDIITKDPAEAARLLLSYIKNG